MRRKKAITLFAGVVLILATAVVSLAQEPTTKTVVQNPDGSFTVIEYPVGKEVQVVLTPVGITSEGVATILRDDAGTRIKVNLNKLPAEMTAINLYAVDPAGAVTLLGPVQVTNGVATFAGTTPLSKFMLIASPEASLATYDPNTKVVFRSSVPQGFAVIPRVTDVEGERVAATTTTTVAPATTTTTVAPATTTTTVTTVAPPTTYTVPMLGIPSFKRGEDVEMKINFSGPLAGARANTFIKPRKDGPTEIRIRFHELKDVPSGKLYIVWAVTPDNKFVKLGQIVNAPGRNEAEVRSETTLADFGLLVTTEDATSTFTAPAGPSIGVVRTIDQ